jgi:hypothetical protein
VKEDIRWQEAHSVSDYAQATIAESFGLDPLLRLITRAVHRPWQAGVAILVANAIVLFGVGLFVAKVYPEANVSQVFDPEELYVSIFLWLIFVPIMWLAYVWMPQGVLKTVLLLQRNGVIPTIDNCFTGELDGGGSKSSQEDLLFVIVQSFKINRWPIIATALALTVVSNGRFLVRSGPTRSMSVGHLTCWLGHWGTLAGLLVINGIGVYLALRLRKGKWPWPAVSALAVALLANAILPATCVGMPSVSTSPVSFWFVNPGTASMALLMNGMSTYVIAITALTALLSAKEIHTFFRNERVPISVHPLHPDQCGGFGSLGWMALRWGLVAVLLGIWATVLTLSPIIKGDFPRPGLEMLLLYLAYVLLVPLCLLSPVWAAHGAMKKFRDAKLKELAEALESILDSVEDSRGWPVADLQSRLARMTDLRQLYRIVQETTPTWPIAAPAVRAFSITAILPLLSGVLPVALDTLTKRLSH